MIRAYRFMLVALAMAIILFMLAVPAPGRSAAAAPAATDVLSGTWRVSRTCLTICASPKPVLKVIRHLDGDVYATGGSTPQVLYLIGRQVLVHGPKDSILLTIDAPGRLMHGLGVGADGSTFQTTWRCTAARGAAATAQGATPDGSTASRPVRVLMAMGAC